MQHERSHARWRVEWVSLPATATVTAGCSLTARNRAGQDSLKTTLGWVSTCPSLLRAQFLNNAARERDPAGRAVAGAGERSRARSEMTEIFFFEISFFKQVLI